MRGGDPEVDDDTDAGSGVETLAEEAPLLIANATDEPRYLYQQNTAILAFATVFIFEIAIGMQAPATYAMMEAIICQEYYPSVADPMSLAGDPRCKATQVQGKLAMLRGWQTTFDCIPAILCAIPFGILADKIGRKPVLLISFIGLVLTLAWIDVVFLFPSVLPLWTIWFGAVFSLIGGFSSVGPAMLFTILGDVTPQPERATVYFRLNAAFLLAELLATPLGGFLLDIHVWLALGIGLLLTMLSAVVVVFMPETLDLIKKADAQEVEVPDEIDSAQPKETVWQRIIRTVRENAADTWKFIFSNKRVMLLMIPIMFFVVGRFVQELLLQYATKRYDWSWSKAAYLLTIRSTANVLLNIALLPALSTLLMTKFGFTPVSKDLWIARASGTGLVIGALMVAFAFSPWVLSIALVIYASGSGFSAVIRSMLNAFVEPHHQAILNSLLGLLQFVGIMIAAPLLFGSLEKGFELGGPWIGLPFIIAAGCAAVATIIVFMFRLPPARVLEV